AQVAEQAQPAGAGRGLRHRQRHRQDGVGAQLRLVRRAVEVDHDLVDEPLLGGVVPDQLLEDPLAHVVDRPGHAPAPVAGGVAVTQLDRLERAGGPAGRHGRPADRPVVERHLDLHRRVSPRVEDLPGDDALDRGHESLRSHACRDRSPASLPRAGRAGPGVGAAPGVRAAHWDAGLGHVVVRFHDVTAARRAPWVTRLLAAAIVVVFLLAPAVAAVGLGAVAVADLCQAEAFFYQYGAVPAELVTNAQLPRVPTGEAVGGACLLGPPAYEKTPVWSVLSAMFLHAGWLHLLGNLLFLYVFGNNVEDRFGHVGFLAFYLGAGYVASYGFALGFPDTVTPMVGASGAVSGVLGAYLALYPHARVWSLVPVCLFLPLRLPAWLVLGSWFVLQYLYSIGYGATDGTVAYLAHVVGFVFGFLVALPWRR